MDGAQLQVPEGAYTGDLSGYDATSMRLLHWFVCVVLGAAGVALASVGRAVPGTSGTASAILLFAFEAGEAP